jgi:hypothetical protein
MARGDSGEYAAIIKSWLVNIMYGKEGMFRVQALIKPGFSPLSFTRNESHREGSHPLTRTLA